MNLFLRVGLCIHFPKILKEKTRQLLILVSKIITVILQIYFRNLKTCKNTSFGFTESQSQVWNNKNSRGGKLQKGELSQCDFGCVARLLFFSGLRRFDWPIWSWSATA